MKRRQSWLIALVVVALLVAACGPEMATSTPSGAGPSPETTDTSLPPTEVVAGETPQTTSVPGTEVAGPPAPVDPNDWRALGSPDAPVTIVEYSDFQ